MKKIRILVADDHAIVRTGLSSLLGTQKDFAVVGEADDGEAVVAMSRALNPDVIIMDYRMPKLDGATAAGKILAAQPDVKILMLTSYEAAEGIARAIRSGAAGAMMKTDDNENLIAAVRDIANGKPGSDRAATSDTRPSGEGPFQPRCRRTAEYTRGHRKEARERNLHENRGVKPRRSHGNRHSETAVKLKYAASAVEPAGPGPAKPL